MCLNRPEQVYVIGVPVSAVTMEAALEFVDGNLAALRGEYICAANVHTTVMAREDGEYLEVQQVAALVLPDGKPLSVLGRRQTDRPMEKVTGTHFMRCIFTDPRFSGKKHYFYGTDRQTLEQMIRNVRRDYPQLNICGYEPSVFRPLTEAEEEDLARRINGSEADFVWVGIGAPRQELLMNRLRGRVCGVMTGVGGAFQIFAGNVKDAAPWIQNAGLEWLHRLSAEPKRLFKRYVVTNSKFIFYLLTSGGRKS